MKYIWAGLTFLVGFILFVLIHVFFKLNMGGFMSNLMMGGVFIATSFVFIRLDKNKSRVKKTFSKAEEKAFRNTFNQQFLIDNKIDFVLVKESLENGYAFFIKTENFNKLSQEDLSASLKPAFQPRITFNYHLFSGTETIEEINGFVISSS